MLMLGRMDNLNRNASDYDSTASYLEDLEQHFVFLLQRGRQQNVKLTSD